MLGRDVNTVMRRMIDNKRYVVPVLGAGLDLVGRVVERAFAARQDTGDYGRERGDEIFSAAHHCPSGLTNPIDEEECFHQSP